MALVSSLAPSTSLYPAAAPIHTRTTSDPPPLVRALPAVPAHTASGTSGAGFGGMNGGSEAALGGANGRGTASKSGASSRGGPVANGSGSAAPGGVRALPSSQPHGPSAPFVAKDAATPSGLSVPTGARTPSPLPPPPLRVPSRSASTPPNTSASSSSSRPSPAPSPGASGSFSSYHAHSASTSSSSSAASAPAVPAIPRLPAAHLQQQHPSLYMHAAHPQMAHPSFVGQAFPSFAHPHAFPHPAYPFIPSPHPNGPNSYGALYANAGGQITPGGTAEQQKRMQAFQQAQWAQMEMLRNQQVAQQQANDWQQQGSARRRATSGPSPNHSPQYYSNPLPYPPSPSPSLNQHSPQFPSFGAGGALNPSFPPGAMLPQFGGHGYPTPPGSVEGIGRGGESGSSSGGSTREGGYHPYRRDPAPKSSSSESGATSRSASTPRSSHASTPSTSTMPSRAPTPKTQHQLGMHGRSESSVSVSSTLSPQNFPPLPTRSHSSSPSVHSIRTSPLPSSPSSFSRHRTDSANSSHSSAPRQDQNGASASPSRPSPAPRSRQDSFESARSATPVQAQSRPRPSPLGGPQSQNSDDDSDDGAESDGTAEATMTVNAGQVGRSPTMSSMAGTIRTQAPPTAAAVDKGKEKEKKGMKSRFKKAFGGGSSSSNTLTEAELEGRGPKEINGGFRGRTDSSSSSENSTAPRTPSSAHQSHPSIASLASSSTLNAAGDGASTRKPPSSRFRLLNSKLNSSTDNISISSTVSSASVMIRKLGQMGKLARRNSLMGLTKAFKKDKNKGDNSEDEDQPKLSKKDKKKGAVATASVSHATAEAEASPHTAGMSPAAALAKKHQMQYAEQEAADAARAAAAATAATEAARLGPPKGSFQQVAHSRTGSNASNDAASIRSGKWSIGGVGVGRSKTTDDVLDGGRSRALEKEKEKLKSRGGGKGSRFRLGFGGSKTDLHAADGDDASSVAGTGLYDDGETTPRQSLEVLAPPQRYQTYGATYGERETSAQGSADEYEPSLYRQGAVPPKQASKAVRGILKGARTYRQEDYAAPRPAFIRNRASSFDAPQQQTRPGSPGGAALVNVIPSHAQVDGVVPSSTSVRADTHPPTSTDLIHDAAVARIEPRHPPPSSGPYAHPGMNASAPVLAHFTSPLSLRSASAPGSSRRIAFAANLSVHTTWPAAIYDRRAEPATCNRLTPSLAQQIKEELNSFKMEEMEVHPASRKLTHFFV
ncbi:hypothetical protein JCM1841_006889 [Sporobolomyces salmonicolor]